MSSDTSVTDAAGNVSPQGVNGESSDFDDAFDEALIQWYADRSWEDVLLHHGWHTTTLKDKCSCPLWTAPGQHASPKSATTHEAGGCSLRRDSLDPPIHIWTDNPGDELADYLDAHPSCNGTLSKFQVYAILEHGGDFGKAARAAGLPVTKAKSNGTVFGARFDAESYWHTISSDQDDPAIDPDAELDDDDLKTKLLAPDVASTPAPPGTPESGIIWQGAGDDPTDLRLEEIFFNSHKALEHIRIYSRMRGPSPWGVLFKTIGEALFHLPPNVKLPKLFSDDHGELNLILGFAGPSGRGKGQTMGCMPFEWVNKGAPLKKPNRRGASSGEAMATRYVRWEDRPKPDSNSDPIQPQGIAAPTVLPQREVQEVFSDEDGGDDGPRRLVIYNRRGWFDYPEIDTFAAKTASDNSTLNSTARSLWSGETLGGDTKTNNMNVPESTYRGIVSVSMQPSKADAIYADEYGGFAQRLIATLVQDPYVNRLPKYPHDPDAANRMVRPQLDVTALLADGFAAPLRVVEITSRIRDELTDAYQRGARGEDGDPLDSHNMMNRLKVAVGIVVICELFDAGPGPAAAKWYRSGISVTDKVWESAGLAMVHARRVREGVRRGLDARDFRSSRRKGTLLAHQEDGKLRTLSALDADRLAAEVAVLNALMEAPENRRAVRELMTSTFRRHPRYRDRLQANSLFESMVITGYITVVDGTLGGPQSKTVLALGPTPHPRVPGSGQAGAA